MFLLKKTIMYEARQLSKTEGKMKILMILFINVVNIVKKPLRSEHPVCSKGLSEKENNTCTLLGIRLRLFRRNYYRGKNHACKLVHGLSGNNY